MTSVKEHMDELGASSPIDRAPFYRGYIELLKIWKGFIDEGARQHLVGSTVRGMPIYALEVGDPHAQSISVVLAGLHAMEWISIEVGLGTFSRLVKNPPSDRRILYFPLINVDGFRVVEENLRAGRRRYQRANMNGVDLNRNWPTFYSPRHLIGKIFPWLGNSGTHPRSEPEVDSVCRFLDREQESGNVIDFSLSLHSFSRVILTPYGGVFRRPEAFPKLMSAAKQICKETPLKYRPHQISRWRPGFFAHGVEVDHLYEAYGAISMIIECSKGGFNLWNPSTWFEPFHWYNPKDPKIEVDALKKPLETFLRGEY